MSTPATFMVLAAGSGSPPFTPTSIAGLVAWFDFSDITTLWKDTGRTSAVTADADIIKGVTDKSTSGWHLSEATNGPTYKVNITGGKSVARFNGTTSVLAGAAVTASQPNTLLIVTKQVAHHGSVGTGFVDGTTARQIVYSDQATNKWSYYAGTLQVSATSSDTTTFHVHSVVFNGVSSSYRVDGTSVSTANPGANALTALVLGRDSTTNFFQIDLGEWLLYTGAVSTPNLVLLEAYLKAKWGTP